MDLRPCCLADQKGDLAALLVEIHAIIVFVKLLCLVILLGTIWTIARRTMTRAAPTPLDSSFVKEPSDEPPPPSSTDEEEPIAPPPPTASASIAPLATTGMPPPPEPTRSVPPRRRNREVTPMVTPRELDEGARFGHELLPGRNDSAVWLTCLVCRQHCSWRRRDDPTFDQFPRLAPLVPVLRSMWVALGHRDDRPPLPGEPGRDDVSRRRRGLTRDLLGQLSGDDFSER
jgi:hypothetical protein